MIATAIPATQEELFAAIKDTDESRIFSTPRMFIKQLGHLPGLLLGQIVYWKSKNPHNDGWICKTRKELEVELCMSKWEVEKALGIITKLGLVRSRQMKGPWGTKTFFQVVWEKIIRWWNSSGGSPELQEGGLLNYSGGSPELQVSSNSDVAVQPVAHGEANPLLGMAWWGVDFGGESKTVVTTDYPTDYQIKKEDKSFGKVLKDHAQGNPSGNSGEEFQGEVKEEKGKETNTQQVESDMKKPMGPLPVTSAQAALTKVKAMKEAEVVIPTGSLTPTQLGDLWRKLLVQDPEIKFIPVYTQKQLGQFGQFLKKCRADKLPPGPLVECVIKKWGSFAALVKTQLGYSKAPVVPEIGYLLVHFQQAVQLWLELAQSTPAAKLKGYEPPVYKKKVVDPEDLPATLEETLAIIKEADELWAAKKKAEAEKKLGVKQQE